MGGYRPSNYKTRLCKWHEEYGKCTYVGCTFAHGQKELNFYRKYLNNPDYPSSVWNPSATNLNQIEEDEDYYGKEEGPKDAEYLNEIV